MVRFPGAVRKIRSPKEPPVVETGLAGRFVLFGGRRATIPASGGITAPKRFPMEILEEQTAKVFWCYVSVALQYGGG